MYIYRSLSKMRITCVGHGFRVLTHFVSNYGPLNTLHPANTSCSYWRNEGLDSRSYVPPDNLSDVTTFEQQCHAFKLLETELFFF